MIEWIKQLFSRKPIYELSECMNCGFPETVDTDWERWVCRECGYSWNRIDTKIRSSI